MPSDGYQHACEALTSLPHPLGEVTDEDACGSSKASIGCNAIQRAERTRGRQADAEAEQASKPTQLLVNDSMLKNDRQCFWAGLVIYRSHLWWVAACTP